MRPVSFSFRKQSFTEPSFQQLEILPLSSSALLAYLQERGINPHWRKENAGRHGLRTTASGTSPLRFRTYRAVMKSATDIARAVLRRKKYPISDSRESKGTRVMFLRDLWTTSHF